MEVELDVSQMIVKDLRAELKKRGLSTNGLKTDLVSRLEDALMSEKTSSPSSPISSPTDDIKSTPLSPRAKRYETRRNRKSNVSVDDSASDSSTRTISESSSPSKSSRSSLSSANDVMLAPEPKVEPSAEAPEAPVDLPKQEAETTQNVTAAILDEPAKPIVQNAHAIQSTTSVATSTKSESIVWRALLILLLWAISIIAITVIFPSPSTQWISQPCIKYYSMGQQLTMDYYAQAANSDLAHQTQNYIQSALNNIMPKDSTSQ